MDPIDPIAPITDPIDPIADPIEPIADPHPHLEVVAVEGQRAADQGVQDDPQAPDVHLRPVVLLALEKLRRRVWRGAAKRVQFGAQPEFVAEAKIRDLDVGVGVQQEVLSLKGGKRETMGGLMGS